MTAKGIFSSKPAEPEHGSPAFWIRHARENFADAQNETRADRALTAAVLRDLVRGATPDEIEQGYAAPLRPQWGRQ